jgi:hypothetical protein
MIATTLFLISFPPLISSLNPVPVVPGIEYVRIVETNPPLVVTAIRINPKIVEARSYLAGGGIYEPGAYKGRGTVSQMVKESGAIGGINGDFFQWGADPGGKPEGFAVSGGEFLSQPNSNFNGAAVGWGKNVTMRLLNGKWKGSVTFPDGSKAGLSQFNGRVDKDRIGFATHRAGSIYASEAATIVRLAIAHDTVVCGETVNVTVRSISKLDGVEKIGSKEAVLVATGKADRLNSLREGDTLKVELGVDAELNGVSEVMGGGPMLLKNGEYIGPKQKSDLVETRHPRSAIGRTSDDKVWLVLIDGRQSMSQGTTIQETADWMKKLGCVDAMNLDGGGSSALNLFGMTLNRPSGGIQRAVANGIMLFAKPNVDSPASAFNYDFGVPATIEKDSKWKVKLAERSGKPVDFGKFPIVCQGAAWINAENELIPLEPGIADLYALVKGVVIHQMVKVR